MSGFLKTFWFLILNLLLLLSCSNSNSPLDHNIEKEKTVSYKWVFDSIPKNAPSCIEVVGVNKEDINLTDNAGISAVYSTNSTLYFKGDPYSGIIKACGKDGKLNGIWTYKNGRCNGLVACYYTDTGGLDEVYEASDGYFDGKAKEYHGNGVKKSEGHFSKGLKDSKWIYFDKNGLVKKIEIFEKGELLDCDGDCE